MMWKAPSLVLMLIALASGGVDSNPVDVQDHFLSTSGNAQECVKIPDKPNCDADNLAADNNLSLLDVNNIRTNFVGHQKGKRKVLMSWIAKAGCTQAQLMFLDYMGYKQEIDFDGWPHDFKNEYHEECGYANPCMYFDDSWYRFKVVRNPFDRAVSSYLHVMKTQAVKEEYLIKGIPKIRKKGAISFNDFLTYIERKMTTPIEMAGLHDGFHIRKQCYDFEFYAWLKGKKMFHRIVKLERLQEDMELVNRDAGTNFRANFSSNHYIKRHNETDAIFNYTGNIPYNQLRGRIPQNYGLFYNEDSIRRVRRLFFQDLLVYDYEYPF